MVVISKREVNELLTMKYMAEITQVKETIRLFSLKYNSSFKQFEENIQNFPQESFEQWDDYLEWKADEDYIHYLTQKLNKIQSGDFEIA